MWLKEDMAVYTFNLCLQWLMFRFQFLNVYGGGQNDTIIMGRSTNNFSTEIEN